jgi:hypothetical protein
MSNLTNNPLFGIDKYSGTFEQDELGVTQIPTATIQSLNDFTLLSLFTFLASCPSTWKLNAKHLSTHFNCNKDKIYAAIDKLIELTLLTRTQIRDKGKFVRFHYRIHLRPRDGVLPRLEKPDTVNPDAYKTYILPLENKKEITTTVASSHQELIIEEPQKKSVVVVDFIISEKFDKQILAARKTSNHLPSLTDKQFLERCKYHLDHCSKAGLNPFQKIHGLCTLIAKGEFISPLNFKCPIEEQKKKEAIKEKQLRLEKAQNLAAEKKGYKETRVAIKHSEKLLNGLSDLTKILGGRAQRQ